MLDWLRLIAVVPILAMYFIWHVIAKCLEAVADGAAYIAVASWYTASRVMGVPDDRIRIVRRNEPR